jgi:outer membrane protein assembly factor BamB
LVSRHALYPSVSAAGGRVYVAGGDGYTYALDGATGRPLWHRQTGNFTEPPLAYQDLVYVGSPQSQIIALDAATGGVRWRQGRPATEASTGTLMVAHGLLYASGVSAADVIDPRTGRVLSQFTGQLLGAANGFVYLTDDEGSVIQARSSATKELAWTVRPPGAQFNQLTAGDGLVYLGVVNADAYECCTHANKAGTGWSGFISAYTATTGRHVWSYPAPEGDFSAPLVASGVVYVAGNLNVYALDAATGKALWVKPTTEQMVPANLEISPLPGRELHMRTAPVSPR